MSKSWQFWIDTGGTFTDCIAISPRGETDYCKVLSNSTLRGRIEKVVSGKELVVSQTWSHTPEIFTDFTFTTRECSTQVRSFNSQTGTLVLKSEIPALEGDDFSLTSGEEAPVLCVRLITGTALNETFPPIEFKLGTTKGTNALLESSGAKVGLLVTEGFEDLLMIGNQQRPHLFQLDIPPRKLFYSFVLGVRERIASDGDVLLPLTVEELQRIQQELENQDIESLAICFMNSYRNPDHEIMVASFLSSTFPHISVSHEMTAGIHYLPRCETTVINAYLTPVINRYIDGIDRALAQPLFRIMESSGGIVRKASFRPKDSLLSGPAGGVMGASYIARKYGFSDFISFDMGGTSTDTSRFHGGPDFEYRTIVGGATVMSPAISIQTVAAGGGSVCKFEHGLLKIGPDSAGAYPGPACYGAGGPLTITDIHLLKGNLLPSFFSIPIHREHAEKKFDEIFERICSSRKATKKEVLDGYLQVASQIMAQAIREVSISKGVDPASHVLIPFGGAGGLHACEIAEILNIDQVLFPYHAGILSSLGIGTCPVQRMVEKSILQPLQDVLKMLDIWFNELAGKVQAIFLNEERIAECDISNQLVYLRLAGQHHSIEVDYMRERDLESAFEGQYGKIYGYLPTTVDIEVESIKLIAQSSGESEVNLQTQSYVESKMPHSKFLRWQGLAPGQKISGERIIATDFSTNLIAAGWTAVAKSSDLIIASRKARKTEKNSAVGYELFFNRFESLAKEMGAQLQRTAFSVNVKERLDFSCAVLDADGFLLVNAPHIPVHLGSLGVCTRSLVSEFPLNPGDVLITNHPHYGGSHLPDITLVSGVFTKKAQLVGYVANRAHHAEIGGKTPGSMPTDATNLEEEGVIIPPLYLIRRGRENWNELEDVFRSARFPSRSVGANLADIRAALASLSSGQVEFQKLLTEFELSEIVHYMSSIRKRSRLALQQALSKMNGMKFGGSEELDDGSVLSVAVSVANSLISFDFTGTSPVHRNNMNANNSIVQSVIIYVLRLLVARDIPLNEGMMELVDIQLPECLLNPDFSGEPHLCPAVVGGNTEVSQRLTDTILKALGLAACSQGTMNNLLFGNDHFGYYETIAGGTGAGPGFRGRSAVHQHMTNTRITDPEELEFRFPVKLNRFSVRRGSGGKGRWMGGDGVHRSMTFYDHLQVTVMAQHRRVPPYGLQGGSPGKTGNQQLIRSDGTIKRLEGIDSTEVAPGDTLIIETPGGGGFGNTEK